LEINRSPCSAASRLLPEPLDTAGLSLFRRGCQR
jgi:hypothetical protein